MDSALDERFRASPSGPPVQAPRGVGCVQRPSHEHERPAPRLRVQSFPAISDPAGTTTSADFSTVRRGLSTPTVPSHPASTPRVTGHPRTPAETSTDKTSNLPRTPTAYTRRPLDGHRASPSLAGSPGPPRLTRAALGHHADAPYVPRVAISPPASFPPRLAATQLPSTCGWCHQPPQGTCTPELLVMPRVLTGSAGLLAGTPACDQLSRFAWRRLSGPARSDRFFIEDLVGTAVPVPGVDRRARPRAVPIDIQDQTASQILPRVRQGARVAGNWIANVV